jgi:hypothetical protein
MTTVQLQWDELLAARCIRAASKLWSVMTDAETTATHRQACCDDYYTLKDLAEVCKVDAGIMPSPTLLAITVELRVAKLIMDR